MSKELKLGALIIGKPGSTRETKTGTWRVERPVIDLEKCNKCSICWLYCPESAVKLRPDGYYEIDLDYCKGCGICAEECPKGAITMLREE